VAVDVAVVVAVAGHPPSTPTTPTTTATATAIPPDDCPVWVRGLIVEALVFQWPLLFRSACRGIRGHGKPCAPRWVRRPTSPRSRRRAILKGTAGVERPVAKSDMLPRMRAIASLGSETAARRATRVGARVDSQGTACRTTSDTATVPSDIARVPASRLRHKGGHVGMGVKRGLTEKSVTPSPRSSGRGRGEAAGVGVGCGGPEVPRAERPTREARRERGSDAKACASAPLPSP
jgi:hypothetical protein